MYHCIALHMFTKHVCSTRRKSFIKPSIQVGIYSKSYRKKAEMKESKKTTLNLSAQEMYGSLVVFFYLCLVHCICFVVELSQVFHWTKTPLSTAHWGVQAPGNLAVYSTSASFMRNRWSVDLWSPVAVIPTRIGLCDVSLFGVVWCIRNSLMLIWTSNEKVFNKNRVIRMATKRTETSAWPPMQCTYIPSPLCCIQLHKVD